MSTLWALRSRRSGPDPTALASTAGCSRGWSTRFNQRQLKYLRTQFYRCHSYLATWLCLRSWANVTWPRHEHMIGSLLAYPVAPRITIGRAICSSCSLMRQKTNPGAFHAPSCRALTCIGTTWPSIRRKETTNPHKVAQAAEMAEVEKMRPRSSKVCSYHRRDFDLVVARSRPHDMRPVEASIYFLIWND